MEYIKGNLKKTIFKSDNGFIVGLFKVRSSSENLKEYINKTITFTGYFHDLNENDIYKLNGNFITHDRYGNQFSVSDYEIVLPDEKDNIIEFLSSSLFPKIGEKKATLIVEELGDNALKKILEDSKVLDKVKLTKKEKETIITKLEEHEKSYSTVLKLTNIGFSMKNALKIYNKYKEDTLSIINDNPYIISAEIKEINFNIIDKYRNSLNIKENDIRRIKAAILYSMEYFSFYTGNTYMNLNEVILSVKRFIFFNDELLITKAIEELKKDFLIINKGDDYYLSETFFAEEEIANRVYYLSNSLMTIKIDEEKIEELEEKMGIEYNKLQKEAIIRALKNNFLIITGGPGTGKTTIIKGICNLYKNIYNLSDSDLLKELFLLAPTGRAAKRISEQTNLPAYTIHRFLKWNKEDNTFRVNIDNKSSAKYIIIDEASMIDTNLFYNLLLGINKNCRIILIGDYNQLPSVGPGQVLKDIIESEITDTIYLKKLYRQEESSKINILANNITNNTFSIDIFNESEDLTFIKCNPSDVKNYIKNYILEYKNYDLNKIQVLAPIYKGDNGIDELNYFIQSLINPSSNKKETIIDAVKYKEGDKVLQLVNLPDENIYNGDIGFITSINNKKITIDYDGNITTFEKNSELNIKLGYAISIHKSQGSEFDVVILPVLNIYKNMLYKKLIYTAITRAKKKLIIIGEIDAFKKGILNNKEDKRKTSLKKFLIDRIN